MKNINSLGGGWQSSYMAIKYDYDEIIFIDVGEESEETYDFLTNQLFPYLAKLGKKVTVISRPITHNQPNLYDYYMKNQGIPMRSFRSCTDKFKIQVMRKYIRTKYGKSQKFIMDLGITIDELDRMTKSDVSYITNNYPLIDDRYTAIDCHNELEKLGFTNIPRSGCFFCPFEKRERFIKYVEDKPHQKERVLKLENNARDRNEKYILYDKPLEVIFNLLDRQQPLDKWFSQSCKGGHCFT